ncbi:MAG TPA: hypothetical protein ENN21_01600, partial [Spirochaetes bacterium]|nr:hypothetical protein [Spirochaetota bacterium]
MKIPTAWLSFLRKHYYLLTGPLMFLSFPSHDLFILKFFPLFAWFSLVPLLVYVRGRELKQVYLSSFLTGLLGIFFVYHWIGDFGFRVPGGNVFILAFIVPSLSVVFSGKIFLAELLSRKHEKLRFVIYPAVWISLDGLQSIGFLAFPWTYWGYSQYTFTSLIQISSIVGIFGVSFLVVAGNTVLAGLLHEKCVMKTTGSPKLYRATAVMAGVVMLCVIYGAITLRNAESGRGPSDRMKIAAVQTCIDPWENWSSNRFTYLDTLKELTGRAMEKGSDFIIWSESATLELISFNYKRNKLDRFDTEVLETAKKYGVPLLTGEIGVRLDVLQRRLY